MPKKSSSDPALAAAVEATIVALAALPAKAVLAPAKAWPMLFFGPKTQTDETDRRPLAKAFASAADVTRAIEQRTPEIKAMALTLLVNADEEAGAPFLLPIMRRDLAGYPFGTWQMDLLYTVGAALQQLSKRLSPAVFVELLALGRISELYLPEGTFARVSVDDLARIAKEQPGARGTPGWKHRVPMSRHPRFFDSSRVGRRDGGVLPDRRRAERAPPRDLAVQRPVTKARHPPRRRSRRWARPLEASRDGR